MEHVIVAILCSFLMLAESLPETTTAPLMRLRMKTNSFGVGRVIPSSQPGVVGWHNEGFTEPFLFEVDAVRSMGVYRAADLDPNTTENSFVVETRSGEAFVGSILRLDQDTVSLHSNVYGTISISREDVISLIRVEKPGKILYPGVFDSKTWIPAATAPRANANEADHRNANARARETQGSNPAPSNSPAWEVRGGMLHALRQRAAIVGEVILPARCEIVLSLSWKGIPDFVIRLGAGSAYHVKSPVPAAARIEVWNRNVILVRETEHDADLSRLVELNEFDPQLSLRVFLDQIAGLAVVHDSHGRRLGQVRLESPNPQVRSSVHIGNHGPSLTVERFEVRSWDGVSQIGSEGEHAIRLVGGQGLGGHILSLSDNRQTFSVKLETGIIRHVAVAEVAHARLGKDEEAIFPPSALDTPIKTEDKSEKSTNVEVVLFDRSRFQGEWLPEVDGKLGIRSNTLEQDIYFEAHQLTGLVGTNERFTTPRTDHRNGVLTVEDSEMSGYLVDSNVRSSSDVLNWNPHGSLTSSSLVPEARGRIVYIQRAHSRSGAGASSNLSAPASWPIHFVSGETVRGQVHKIDEQGVYFGSDETKLTFAEHARLESLWIGPLASSAKQPSGEKVERLKIIPRAMRNDPPTHLLMSISGDLVRCRLNGMDQQMAFVDVHGEQQKIPREQIAQIVWLHHRNWDDSKENADNASQSEPATSIFMAQRDRGVMLVPEKIQSGVLSGNSELLGACSVGLDEVSQILFGPGLADRLSTLKENPWVLSLAPSPRAFAEAGARESEDQERSLVGQEAPNFSLARPDGSSVRLSELMGRVVVLEFWTSWSGPSVKNVEAVREIVAGYDPEKICFLAINVQEAESKAMPAAARLQIIDFMALDPNGKVAADYQAATLPHTVVIDSKGIVRHVAVGGDRRSQAEWKAAIENLVPRTMQKN